MADSLYSRLGGYDAIAAVVDELIPRLQADPRLKRFWVTARPKASADRERQMLLDFLSACAGGPTIYLGRDMKTAHAGMGIDAEDYAALDRHVVAVLEKFKVAPRERDDVMGFIASLRAEIIEK